MLRGEESAGVVDWRRAETALLAVKRLSRGGIVVVVRIGLDSIVVNRVESRSSAVGEVCGLRQISGMCLVIAKTVVRSCMNCRSVGNRIVGGVACNVSNWRLSSFGYSLVKHLVPGFLYNMIHMEVEKTTIYSTSIMTPTYL
jgi:hypothetical protein